MTLEERLWLGAAPLMISTAHLAFGASSRSLSAALVLFVGLLLLAQVIRLSPQRSNGLWFLVITFALVLAIAVWSLTPFTIGERQPIWGLIGATPATTIDKSATVREIAKLLGLGCVFLIGTFQGQRRRDANATIDALLLTGAGVMVIAMAMFAVGGERDGFGGRMIGPFPSPNATGSVAAALLVLAVSRLASAIDEQGHATGRKTLRALERSAPYAAAALLFGMALALTGSRGAIAAAGLAACFWLGWHLLMTRSPVRIASGVAVLLIGSALLVFFLTGRSLTLDRSYVAVGDLDERLSTFQIYWQVFLDSPLFGYGLGSFDAVNRQILDRSNIDLLWSLGAAHNVVVQWLVEAGLVGSIPMFACVVAVAGHGLAKSIGPQKGAATLAGVCMAEAVLLVHGMVDIGLQVYSIAVLLAFLFGLQFSLSQGQRQTGHRVDHRRGGHATDR